MTIFYLMFIAFIPFSTALIGQYGDQQISVIIYGINIIIVRVWTYLQWKYATRDHRLVDSDLDPKFIVKMSRRIIVTIILYMIATAKYSSKSYIIYINPHILSNTPAIFLVSVYQRQVKMFVLELSELLITPTIGPAIRPIAMVIAVFLCSVTRFFKRPASMKYPSFTLMKLINTN
jgi:hypothetical protein